MIHSPIAVRETSIWLWGTKLIFNEFNAIRSILLITKIREENGL